MAAAGRDRGGPRRRARHAAGPAAGPRLEVHGPGALDAERPRATRCKQSRCVMEHVPPQVANTGVDNDAKLRALAGVTAVAASTEAA
jgi:hypothetical protein